MLNGVIDIDGAVAGSRSAAGIVGVCHDGNSPYLAGNEAEMFDEVPIDVPFVFPPFADMGRATFDGYKYIVFGVAAGQGCSQGQFVCPDIIQGLGSPETNRREYHINSGGVIIGLPTLT